MNEVAVMPQHHILLCDDEQEIIEVLKLYLHREDFLLHEANDGETALSILRTKAIDLLLLDIMMPRLNGLDLVKLIRKEVACPILIISARSSLSDRLLAYDIGADDYITKPFEPLEVLAKVEARLRLPQATISELNVDKLCLDLERCTLEIDGVDYDLTKVEFQVLRQFMAEPGRVFTKAQIYEAGWNQAYFHDDNSIHVIINRLRNKVGQEKIETIRGLGYRFQRNQEK